MHQIWVDLTSIWLEDDGLLGREAVVAAGIEEKTRVVNDFVDDGGIGHQGQQHHGAPRPAHRDTSISKIRPSVGPSDRSRASAILDLRTTSECWR